MTRFDTKLTHLQNWFKYSKMPVCELESKTFYYCLVFKLEYLAIKTGYIRQCFHYVPGIDIYCNSSLTLLCNMHLGAVSLEFIGAPISVQGIPV